MTKVQLVPDLFSLDITVSDIHLVIGETAHRECDEGFEILGAVSPKIEEVFDSLAMVVGDILDAFPGDPSLMEMYLEGLKGAIIQYFLLFSATKKR